MKAIRFTVILAIAMAALGAALGAYLFAPAQPRLTTTDEGHRG